MSTESLLHPLYIKADKLMLAVIWALFGISCLLARETFSWAPVGWVGLPTAVVASAMAYRFRGTLATRLVIAASLMVFCALQIHQAEGWTEMHFGIFVALAFLLAYRDWRPVVCAATVIAVHHVAFHFLQIRGFGVYCFTQPSLSTVFVHAGYVVAEAGLLVVIAHQMKADARTGRELALLGANLSREAGKFDLRIAPVALHGASSRTFKGTLDAIHVALQQVTAIIDSMASSTDDIATENHDLFEQIAEQASGLKTANTSIMQIAERIRDSATHAETANGLARDTSQAVLESGRVVGEVAGKMDQIDVAVQRMRDMIATIESIAFQTNILALNASVEAVRAGNSGRGFAVVAAEVRLLAQRSASAASDIKDLIADSQRKVEQGSALASRAGETMTQVVSMVSQVAALIEQISTTSDAQAADVGRFCESINDMDSVLEGNVEHVKKVAHASGSLRERAQTLRDAISAFIVERADRVALRA